MKALKIAAAVIAALVVVTAGGLAWIVNTLISGGAKDQLVAQASAALGAPVGIDYYSIDFGSLLQLRPGLTVKGLTVGSPQGFRGQLLVADQVAVRLDLNDALQRKVHVTLMEVRSPRILVQIPAEGPSNLEALVAQSSRSTGRAAPANASPEPIEVRVDRIALMDGTVTVESALTPRPQAVLRALDLRLENLATGRPADLSLRGKLFDSTASTIDLSGAAGPFGGTLPLNGKVAVVLAPVELPRALLTRFLGELSSAPGPKSRLRLELALKGVLEGQLNGQGRMSFEEFLLGGTGGSDRLALGGDAPLTAVAERVLSGGPWRLQSRGAQLRLGSGQWQGNLQVNRSGEALNGAIDGVIRGVDLNQMLTSFAGLPGQLQGALTLPRFALRFAGKTPAQIQASLAGDGELQVTKGQARALDVLSAVESALGGKSNAPKGSFEELSTTFTIRSQVMQLTGLRLRAPGVSVTGGGTIGFNEALNLQLQTQITDAAASALGSVAGRYLGDPIALAVNVGGTVSNPQVKPEMRGLVKNAALGVADRLLKDAPDDSAAGAVKGILGGLFGRKKK